MTIRSIDRTVTTETPFYVLTKMEYDLKLRRVANRRKKPGIYGVCTSISNGKFISNRGLDRCFNARAGYLLAFLPYHKLLRTDLRASLPTILPRCPIPIFFSRSIFYIEQALLHARLPCGTNFTVGTILISLQQLSHAFVNKPFPPLTNRSKTKKERKESNQIFSNPKLTLIHFKAFTS